MTRRELNLAIFEEKAEAILWQPRLDTWLYFHREQGTLPSHLKDLDDLEIYDTLGCSCRYHASAGLESFYDPAPEHGHTQDGIYFIDTTRTAVGELRTISQGVWEDGKLVNQRVHKYPVKTAEDLRVAISLVNCEQYRINAEAYQATVERVGHREEPTGWLSSAGFTELIKNYTGLVDAFYLLADHPALVEEYLEACDNRDDRMLTEAFKLPFRIFNLGDHATNEFTPPPILKKYMLPRWQKISAQMQARNCYVHSHWDGHSKTMLPYLRETGLHAIEALTPEPMGDMTLEEIKAAVGDKMVCLDLIPAILFLEQYPMQTVLDFSKRVIDMFAPRLILGVSDELPPGGQIEKIEAVSELVRDTCGLAE